MLLSYHIFDVELTGRSIRRRKTVLAGENAIQAARTRHDDGILFRAIGAYHGSSWALSDNGLRLLQWL